MANKPTSPPPAYFLSLSLENVRSFGAKQTISFAREDGRPAQWTIILGDNGVGKTTVLKALASVVKEDGSPSDEPYGRAAMWRIANSTWSPHRNNDSLMAELETAVIQDALLNGSKAGEDFEIIYSSVAKVNGGGMMSQRHNPRSLICYGYGAGRTTGNSTLSETPEAVDTCASIFDDRADLLNPEEWFLNIDYGSKLAGEKNKQLADARDRVEKMLIDVLPGVTKIQIAAAGTPQKPQISLQFLLHDTWVRLRDMSLGYQTLVVWLTDLASKLYVRYPESDNPLAEPAIVLIDEIDLHLHPKWQRELLSVLSSIFPETQFIATAHSPLVVQAAGDEGANVVLLRREGDQTVVVTDVEDVRGWRVDQILTSTFFNLETARSLETEKKLARQAKLLNKLKLTAKERRELEDLTQELEGQPMGSTRPHAEEEEAELLRQITERLGSSLPNLNVGQ